MKKQKLRTIGMILLAIAALSSCDRIKGEGVLNTYTPTLSSFESIEIEIPAIITITKGDASSLSINIQDNIYRNTEIKVEDEELQIEFDKKILKHKAISIDIVLSDINDIELKGLSIVNVMDKFETNNDVSIATSGSGKININDTLICNRFEYESSGTGALYANYLVANNGSEIETSGAGNQKINYLKTTTLEYESSGLGKFEIAGEANSQDLESSGSGKYYGLNFQTKDTKIKTSGAGKFEIAVSENFDIKASGSSTVRYKGNPKITQDTSGSFKLEKLD